MQIHRVNAERVEKESDAFDNIYMRYTRVYLDLIKLISSDGTRMLRFPVGKLPLYGIFQSLLTLVFQRLDRYYMQYATSKERK